MSNDDEKLELTPIASAMVAALIGTLAGGAMYFADLIAPWTIIVIAIVSGVAAYSLSTRNKP